MSYFKLDGAYNEISLFDTPSQYQGMKYPRMPSYIDNNECNAYTGKDLSRFPPLYPTLKDYPHYEVPSHLQTNPQPFS